MSRLAARAHRFHRFAHHPLCGAYEAEVLPLGRRMRVCAGCTWTCAGAFFGLVVAACFPQARLHAAWALGLQALSAVWWISTRACHAHKGKWLLRGMPGVLLAAGIGLAARLALHGPPPTWAALTEAVLGATMLGVARMYRRRAPWRAPCTDCPQRHDAVCDGWRRIVQRERALHRLSGRIIEQATSSH